MIRKYLSGDEIRLALERLFPFPEDMGPHLPPFTYRKNDGTLEFPEIKSQFIFPLLIASDIISVQPMNLPSAQVFYSDFKYGHQTHHERVK